MSQQQLVPEPQDQDVGRPSYRFKTQQHTGDGPKEEHPATFEETVPPYSYPAQDHVTYKKEEKVRQSSRVRQHQRHEDDGDAFETGYRPYRQSSYRQVPPWARPQRHRNIHIWRWFIVMGLILLTIKILPLIVLVIAGLLSVLGVLAFVLLLSFIILFGLLAMALIIILLLSASMRRFVRRLFGRRRWGGPWI